MSAFGWLLPDPTGSYWPKADGRERQQSAKSGHPAPLGVDPLRPFVGANTIGGLLVVR